MGLVIGIGVYLLIGLMLYVYFETDAEIKTDEDLLAWLAGWPILIAFIFIGGLAVAFSVFVDWLCGKE
jgi:hypothetical protein